MSPWLLAVLGLMAYKYWSKKRGGSIPSVSPQTIPVILNSICVIAGLIYLVSFNPSGRFFCVVSAIVSSIYIIYTNYGLPKVSRAAIKVPLQEYVAQCLTGAEFPFLFFAMMFTNDYAYQVGGGIIPFGIADYLGILLILRRSLWFIGSHGSRAWVSNPVWGRYGNLAWALLKSRETAVMSFVNIAEIFIGLWMTLLVITPARQILNTFVYWNLLRIKYMAPRSRGSHIAAWSWFDAKTKGVRSAVPLLDKPVQIGVKWFNQQTA